MTERPSAFAVVMTNRPLSEGTTIAAGRDLSYYCFNAKSRLKIKLDEARFLFRFISF
jgi:hypothetical protein